MLHYPHPIEPSFIHRCLNLYLESPDWYQESLRDNPNLPLSYTTSTAIANFTQGLGAAWALQESVNMALFRSEISALTETTLNHFPPDSISEALNVSTLSMFGLGADPEAFRSLAATRLTYPDQGPDPDEAPGVMATELAIAAIANDEDEVALHAATLALTQINDELAPPDLSYLQMPAMILAILDQDENSFRHAIDAANAQWAQRAVPARGYRAGANTLINQFTSTMCRIAKWRGLTTPHSPYIIEITD